MRIRRPGQFSVWVACSVELEAGLGQVGAQQLVDADLFLAHLQPALIARQCLFDWIGVYVTSFKVRYHYRPLV